MISSFKGLSIFAEAEGLEAEAAELETSHGLEAKWFWVRKPLGILFCCFSGVVDKKLWLKLWLTKSLLKKNVKDPVTEKVRKILWILRTALICEFVLLNLGWVAWMFLRKSVLQ